MLSLVQKAKTLQDWKEIRTLLEDNLLSEREALKFWQDNAGMQIEIKNSLHRIETQLTMVNEVIRLRTMLDKQVTQ